MFISSSAVSHQKTNLISFWFPAFSLSPQDSIFLQNSIIFQYFFFI
jgi:hypothetical protein